MYFDFLYSGQEKAQNEPAIGDEFSLDIPNISNELVVSGHLGKKHEEGWDIIFVYGDMIYRHMREPANQDLNDKLEKHWIETLEQQSVKDFFFFKLSPRN